MQPDKQNVDTIPIVDYEIQIHCLSKIQTVYRVGYKYDLVYLKFHF